MELEHFNQWKQLEDSQIQLVLREISSDDLVIALSGADEELIAAIKKNMSSRAVEKLEKDSDDISDLTQEEVFKARRLIDDIIVDVISS